MAEQKMDKTDKKALKIVLVVLAVFVAGLVWLFSTVFGATSALADSADKFLALVKQGKMQEAFELTDPRFKRSTTFEEFSAYMKGTGVDKFGSASWTNREVKNDLGRLEGTIKNADNADVGVEMNLAKSDNVWNILNLRFASDGLENLDTQSTDAKSPNEESGNLTIPSDSDVEKLTNSSMKDFAEAVNTGDFSSFYNNTAKLWQSQTTAEELKIVFKLFIENKVDISKIVTEIAPVFSEKPALSGKNALAVKGYYPGKDMIVNFSMKYVYEYPEWKLIGLQVNLK